MERAEPIRDSEAIKASAVRVDNQWPLQPLGFEEVMHTIALGTGVSQKLLSVAPWISCQRRLMELPDDVGLTGP